MGSETLSAVGSRLSGTSSSPDETAPSASAAASEDAAPVASTAASEEEAPAASTAAPESVLWPKSRASEVAATSGRRCCSHAIFGWRADS